MLALLLCLACAFFQLTPVEVTPTSYEQSNVSNPYEGDDPCADSIWSVSCEDCSPPWTRTATLICDGVADEKWPVEVLDLALAAEGGLDDVRAIEERKGEEWTVQQERKLR